MFFWKERSMQFRMSPSPNISARSFGDEIVAANFVSGIYYSMLGSAAQIWEGLIAGAPRDHVVSEVAALSDCDPAEFASAGAEFIDALLAEQLIVPAEGLKPVDWKPAATVEAAYGPPMLQRFDDMADLLVIDPVHDVEDMGWPHASATQTT